MAKKKQEKKVEINNKEKQNKPNNSNKKTTNKQPQKNNKNKNYKKNNQQKKKEVKIVEEKVVEEVVENIEEVNVETNEPIEETVLTEEQKEEKLSKTFIEKTKKLLDDHDEYVENALEEEEFEKTQEFENTQLLKIREALKPIGKPKKKHYFRRNSDIDEDFMDVNNKDEHLFLKLVLIIGSIALFIWLMPKIAFAIDEHFILDNEYEPYVPEEKEEEKTEEKEEENIKSETKLTEEEIKNMLNSIPSETLMLPTSTKDYTLTFDEETMNINSIECYMIEVSAIVDDEPNHIASFAVSIYGEKIFKATTSGGYEEIKFVQ